jgi:hypothetical protein
VVVVWRCGCGVVGGCELALDFPRCGATLHGTVQPGGGSTVRMIPSPAPCLDPATRVGVQWDVGKW